MSFVYLFNRLLSLSLWYKIIKYSNMKKFKKGDSVRIKRLNELTYTEQDQLSLRDYSKLGYSATFMYYEENGMCAISVEGMSYTLPDWLIHKCESEHSISRHYRLEQYQCTSRKDLMARIAYLVEKTAFNFKVIQGQKDIKLYIEE